MSSQFLCVVSPLFCVCCQLCVSVYVEGHLSVSFKLVGDSLDVCIKNKTTTTTKNKCLKGFIYCIFIKLVLSWVGQGQGPRSCIDNTSILFYMLKCTHDKTLHTAH